MCLESHGIATCNGNSGLSLCYSATSLVTCSVFSAANIAVEGGASGIAFTASVRLLQGNGIIHRDTIGQDNAVVQRDAIGQDNAFVQAMPTALYKVRGLTFDHHHHLELPPLMPSQQASDSGVGAETVQYATEIIDSGISESISLFDIGMHLRFAGFFSQWNLYALAGSYLKSITDLDSSTFRIQFNSFLVGLGLWGFGVRIDTERSATIRYSDYIKAVSEDKPSEARTRSPVFDVDARDALYVLICVLELRKADRALFFPELLDLILTSWLNPTADYPIEDIQEFDVTFQELRKQATCEREQERYTHMQRLFQAAFIRPVDND